MIKKQKTIQPVSSKPVMAPAASAKGKPMKGRLFVFIILIVVVAAGALAIVQQFKYNGRMGQRGENWRKVSSNAPLQKDDIQGLIKRISDLIVIKADEEPTVATVQDANLLRQNNPLFYQDAENGDRLLVWSDKAVLYSTRMDKLLSVMPIALLNASQQAANQTVGNQPPQPTSDQQQTTVLSENAKIQVLNGTATPGMAKKLSAVLAQNQIKVATMGDAKDKTYAKTIIVKLSDKPLTATLQALQTVLNAEVVSAPSAEKGLSGDVAIIVGTDFK